MGMMPTATHGGSLGPLTWSALVSTWHVAPGFLAVAVAMAAVYGRARLGARGGSTVGVWRVACFMAGCALLWLCVASGIGAYSMSVFWMHMVLHLLLIMVVPALLVLGHPLTVAVESMSPGGAAGMRRVLCSRPIRLGTHPVTGLVVYSAVIVGTHLTGFMDQMATHPWLMTAEQVLYVVTGYLFVLPLLGEEPLATKAPYLLRLALLVVATVPDTVVGIVLLQTDRDPFPVMMAHHPAWAPSPLTDVHVAGALMWVAGDGLMMTFSVGLMIAVVTSPARRALMTGPWLDGVRRSRLVSLVGASDHEGSFDPDSDAALNAYNQMLHRIDGGPPPNS